jgi:hypothetical protein
VGVPITQYDLLVSRFGTGDSGVQLLESADRDGPSQDVVPRYLPLNISQTSSGLRICSSFASSWAVSVFRTS